MPNIELPPDFPSRLRGLRTERGYAESELGTRAGLTYKTIRDLEMGKRRRVMERTILVLAEALGLTVDELLNGTGERPTTTAPRSRYLRAVLSGVAIALAVVLLIGVGAAWYARDHAQWEVGRDVLTVRDPIFGFTLWERETDAWFTFCEESPWSSRWLIVGLGSKSPAGGRVLCLERTTGDTVWSVGPDVDAVVRAFGPADVYAANFRATIPRTANLDGDGTPDLVIRFIHGLYYPCVMAWIDQSGRLVAQYANKGHVADYKVIDCNGDGLDEVVCWGTNNSPAYQGGTLFVLDAAHWRGASIDDACNPESSEPDSSALRVVVPQYPEPYMDVMGTRRLGIYGLQAYRGPDGDTMFSAGIGSKKEHTVVVTFDRHLRPTGASPTDGFLGRIRAEWPDSLVASGPADQVWLARWLAGHKRFAAGRPASAP